jgi:hypothetical protein
MALTQPQSVSVAAPALPALALASAPAIASVSASAPAQQTSPISQKPAYHLQLGLEQSLTGWSGPSRCSEPDTLYIPSNYTCELIAAPLWNSTQTNADVPSDKKRPFAPTLSSRDDDDDDDDEIQEYVPELRKYRRLDTHIQVPHRRISYADALAGQLAPTTSSQPSALVSSPSSRVKHRPSPTKGLPVKLESPPVQRLFYQSSPVQPHPFEFPLPAQTQHCLVKKESTPGALMCLQSALPRILDPPSPTVDLASITPLTSTTVADLTASHDLLDSSLPLPYVSNTSANGHLTNEEVEALRASFDILPDICVRCWAIADADYTDHKTNECRQVNAPCPRNRLYREFRYNLPNGHCFRCGCSQGVSPSYCPGCNLLTHARR